MWCTIAKLNQKIILQHNCKLQTFSQSVISWWLLAAQFTVSVDAFFFLQKFRIKIAWIPWMEQHDLITPWATNRPAAQDSMELLTHYTISPPQNDTHFGCYSFDINHPIYHSVLWRCWLGIRKGIRPVKNWVVGCWCGYLSGARCRLAYGPAHATHCLLLQENPDRFYLSGTGSLGVRVVPEKGLLSACVCV